MGEYLIDGTGDGNAAKVNTRNELLTSANLVDSSGNPIVSHIQADGDYHLGTTITQSVHSDPNNTSSTNLVAGGTFTGVATTTLGIVGLQWSLKTNENCTVYVEESDTGTSNWDISNHSDYIASKGGRGETVQATKAFWRIRVTNVSINTTSYFRLSGVLCPIAVPLPSALSDNGRLKSESTLTGRENTDRHVWVNSTNELAISPVYRLVGTAFINGEKDPRFWTDGSINSGTVTQTDGEVILSSSATLSGSAKYSSKRRGRFVAGSAQLFSGGFNFFTAGTAGNIRRIGAYDVDEGFFFQLVEDTFSIGTRLNTSDTLVNSGSFNGNLGEDFCPVANTYYLFTIEYTPLAAFYYVNGVLLHKKSGAVQVGTMTLPITMESTNNAATNTAVVFKTVGMYIARQGELKTNPIYYYHALGQETGVNLKIGAGKLHTIIFNNVVRNTVITISDSITGLTPTIIAHTAGDTRTSISAITVDAPFSTGLRLTVSGANASLTLIYE